MDVKIPAISLSGAPTDRAGATRAGRDVARALGVEIASGAVIPKGTVTVRLGRGGDLAAAVRLALSPRRK